MLQIVTSFPQFYQVYTLVFAWSQFQDNVSQSEIVIMLNYSDWIILSSDHNSQSGNKR